MNEGKKAEKAGEETEGSRKLAMVRKGWRTIFRSVVGKVISIIFSPLSHSKETQV